jgi:hypothetical protein
MGVKNRPKWRFFALFSTENSEKKYKIGKNLVLRPFYRQSQKGGF